MKLILTGSTGFIGAEVLRQCLNNPSISSIIALSRRPLPVTDPKLKTVIVEDFTNYSPSVLKELEGAEACIWTLGVKTVNAEIQKKVTLDYTLAALNAFSSLSSPKQPLRFIFTSGILAVREQSKTLLVASDARKIKGEAETLLLDVEKEHSDSLQAFIVRPGTVLAHEGILAGLAAGLGVPAVSVQGLAAVMVDMALRGKADGERVLDNKELVVMGRELLKAKVEKGHE